MRPMVDRATDFFAFARTTGTVLTAVWQVDTLSDASAENALLLRGLKVAATGHKRELKVGSGVGKAAHGAVILMLLSCCGGEFCL